MTSRYTDMGSGLQHLVPRVRARRRERQRELSHIQLGGCEWGRELIVHEHRKQEMREQASPPSVFWVDRRRQ